MKIAWGLPPKKEPWRLRFYRWLYQYTRRVIENAWLDKYGHDRRCFNCKDYYGLNAGAFFTVVKSFEHIWCPKCEATTVWACTGMLPRPVQCYKHDNFDVPFDPNNGDQNYWRMIANDRKN